MGIDARMEFITREDIGDVELKRADYDIAATLGARVFFGRFGRYIAMTRSEHNPKRHFDLHLSGRYYGRGYERGNLLDYLACADWLEMRFGRVLVFYGGDSDSSLILFDKAVRNDLYRYYITSGSEPYGRAFTRPGSQGIHGCVNCIRPLENCGGGGGDVFLRCPACASKFVHTPKEGKLVRVSDFFKRTLKDNDYTGSGS